MIFDENKISYKEAKRYINIYIYLLGRRGLNIEIMVIP